MDATIIDENKLRIWLNKKLFKRELCCLLVNIYYQQVCTEQVKRNYCDRLNKTLTKKDIINILCKLIDHPQ